MSFYTVFPSGYPFYGGISLAYGTGLHEDYDEDIGQGEAFLADYLNNVEHRIDQCLIVLSQNQDSSFIG